MSRSYLSHFTRHSSNSHFRLMRWIIAVSVVVLPLVIAGPATDAARTTPMYPDLRTLPPSDLRFDTVSIDGVMQPVLRFSNTAWNAGQGPLDLIAKNDRQTKKSQVYQRIYSNTTASGPYDQRRVGDFVFHPAHDHFHFEDFAEYQLWNAAAWDAWVAAGRDNSTENTRVRGQGTKTTFCIMDTSRVNASLPGSPASAAYSTCDRTHQGMSVGWGDTYGYYLADQWVVLNSAVLPDGDYVLRSIADPLNRLYESVNRAAPDAESRTANEAIVRFRVVSGAISIL